MSKTVAAEAGLARERRLRRRAEKRLAEKRRELHIATQKLRSIMNTVGDGLLVSDSDGTIVALNKAAERIFGYRARELVGKPVRGLIPPSEHKLHRALIRDWKRRDRGRGVGRKREITGLRADGSTFPLEFQLGHFELDGSIVYVGSCVDLTERREAEAALAESERRFRTIFENAPEGIYTSSIDGPFLSVNPAMARMHGCATPEEFLAHFNDVESTFYADPGTRQRIIEQMMDEGAITGFECRVLTRDREVFWISESARVVYDENGGIAGFEGFTQDITKRKETEAALERQAQELAEKSQMLTLVLGHMDEGISFYDTDLIVDVFNDRFLELLEFPTDKFEPGDPFEKFVRYNAERGEYGPGDVDEQVRERVELARKFERHQFQRVRPDGTVIQISGKPVEGVGLVTTYTDVTEEVTAKNKLRDSNEALESRVNELESLKTELERKSNDAIRMAEDLRQAKHIQLDAINNISEGFALWGADDRLIMCNGRFRELYEAVQDIVEPGLSYERFVREGYARGVFKVRNGDVEKEISRRVDQHRRSIISLEEQLGDGRWIRVSERKTAAGRIVGIANDISERKRAERRIKEMAETDMLTGLPNRLRFHDKLHGAIETAKRTGRKLAVMLIDLDDFKGINDAHGHPLGDALLREIATRFLDCARSSDTVARLGGDEFAIIATNLKAPLDVEFLAARIVRSMSQPISVCGQRIDTGCSVGIAVFAAGETDPEDLLRNADIALYKAKEKGRGAVRIYDEKMDEEVQARRTIESELRRALTAGELNLFYQPQVRIADGRVVGAEALLRWAHPARGHVSPGEFIPIAEATRLIVPIGEWVLHTACQTAKEWQRSGLDPITISINISPLQFKRQDLAENVARAIDDTGLDPACIELEITESMAMAAGDDVIGLLHELKDLGVCLAIDDFGTGYSSLSRLKDFPVDRLKIDQSFVDVIGVERANETINSTIVQLGHNLGLRVIAEGVETAQQLEYLRNLRCDEAQGYFFAPPLPLNEFVTFLENFRLTAPESIRKRGPKAGAGG